MSKRVNLHTLGCRLNQAETAIITNSLLKNGYKIVDDDASADYTIINTCTVTEQADAKCRQVVRKSIRKNPQAKVAVIGCYAQMDLEAIKRIAGVNMVMGNEHKLKISEYMDQMDTSDNIVVIHSPKIPKKEFIIESTSFPDSQTRANLKIQDGCNFVCSFCIIASARGPARSRKFDDLIKEAKQLVDMGIKEIILTGVNIATYKDENYDFLSILKALDAMDGLERIRISSIEPTTVTKPIIDQMAGSSKICRYLHIPLQSADNEILESMRRKHNAAQFAEIVEYAHEKIPGIGIGTDIMVGYPAEGLEQFINTKKFIVDLPVAYFHVFTYSDRKGTASYRIKPKVDIHEKRRRNKIMSQVGDRKKHAFMQRFVGEKLDVLFEEEYLGYWEGLTDNYIRVKVKSNRNLKNQIETVSLKSVENDKIIGEII